MKWQTVIEKCCFAQWKSEEDGQYRKTQRYTQERETERNWTELEERRGKELKAKEFTGGDKNKRKSAGGKSMREDGPQMDSATGRKETEKKEKKIRRTKIKKGKKREAGREKTSSDDTDGEAQTNINENSIGPCAKIILRLLSAYNSVSFIEQTVKTVKKHKPSAHEHTS